MASRGGEGANISRSGLSPTSSLQRGIVEREATGALWWS